MFKKKNKIENSNASIIDSKNLIIGSNFSGKTPMIINGLDLYYLMLDKLSLKYIPADEVYLKPALFKK